MLVLALIIIVFQGQGKHAVQNDMFFDEARAAGCDSNKLLFFSDTFYLYIYMCGGFKKLKTRILTISRFVSLTCLRICGSNTSVSLIPPTMFCGV